MPHTSSLLAKMIEALFDPGIHHLYRGRQRSPNTVSYWRSAFDYIFFTGSVAVAKTVMEKTKPSFDSGYFELGGKVPVS